jgi:hypothetical protein
MTNQIRRTKDEDRNTCLASARHSPNRPLVSSFVLRPSPLIRHSNFVLRILSAALSLSLPGCIFWSPNPNAKLVTTVDPVQATPDYWWNQPATQHVVHADFHTLWDACKGELYVRLFPLDREEYRQGLITSEPVVSKQVFEPWRNDAQTAGAVAESSIATIRRTVHFEIKRNDDGTYELTPKVLVERWASTERRITSISQYHSVFSQTRTIYDPADQSGAVVASDYWYPLRRDRDLEKAIADDIRAHLPR